MANREQRNNREKKKPKAADKDKKKGGAQPTSAFAAQAPGMSKPGQQPPKK
jgi:hypothetical protein